MRHSVEGSDRPAVMMVTGSYFPETSGAGVQCRALIRACGAAATFSVLTTALDARLAADDEVDDMPVKRVFVSARSRMARWLAAPRLIVAAIALERRADVVHLHGFSAKSRIVIALAKLLGRKIVIKLTSVGHDDPVSMRSKGRRAFRSFSRADRFVAVSPRFEALYLEAGLPPEKFRVIPNGVDLDRFTPATGAERVALRRTLDLPPDLPLVVFVGFFSREKCPDLLFDAWTDTFPVAPMSALVFIGASRSDYYEIDPALADRVRSDAVRLGCSDRVRFVEHTTAIEQYYRASDLFVLPSKREGLPNALLEAMACGLPSIVSRLFGVTDTVITDGIDGVLVESGNRAALATGLRTLLNDAALRLKLGRAARRTVETRYSLAATATQYIRLYRELTSCAASPGL